MRLQHLNKAKHSTPGHQGESSTSQPLFKIEAGCSAAPPQWYRTTATCWPGGVEQDSQHIDSKFRGPSPFWPKHRCSCVFNVFRTLPKKTNKKNKHRSYFDQTQSCLNPSECCVKCTCWLSIKSLQKKRVGRDQRSDCRGIPSLLPNIVYNSARILMENVNTCTV